MRPYAFNVAAAIVWVFSGEVTSTATAMASPPAALMSAATFFASSSCISATTTLAPSFAKPWA